MGRGRRGGGGGAPKKVLVSLVCCGFFFFPKFFFPGVMMMAGSRMIHDSLIMGRRKGSGAIKTFYGRSCGRHSSRVSVPLFYPDHAAWGILSGDSPL